MAFDSINAWGAMNAPKQKKKRHNGGGGDGTTDPTTDPTTPPTSTGDTTVPPLPPYTPPTNPPPQQGVPQSGTYYIPGFDYGSQYQTGGPGTILGDQYINQNPQAAFDMWSQGAGLTNETPFGRYVRAQEPLIQRSYQAALLSNPDLKYWDFLNNYVGSLSQRFQTLPYQLREEQPRLWGQGPLRWIGRSN